MAVACSSTAVAWWASWPSRAVRARRTRSRCAPVTASEAATPAPPVVLGSVSRSICLTSVLRTCSRSASVTTVPAAISASSLANQGLPPR